MTKPKTRIVGLLKTRVNQLAHELAQAYEQRTRLKITAELREAADKGAIAEDLHNQLDGIERNGHVDD